MEVEEVEIIWYYLGMEKQVKWLNACIFEFSARFNLSPRQAWNYLLFFEGVEFLLECYEAEHTLSFDDAIDDVVDVCKHNGGGLG